MKNKIIKIKKKETSKKSKQKQDKKMPEVCVQIVIWNSRKFLKDCLDSVFEQSHSNFKVLIIDNASNDGGLDLVRDFYAKKYSGKIYTLRNVKNLGFSRAHNQGFGLSQSEYVLVLNPDMILTKDFLSQLIDKMEEDQKIGSIGGKLLKVRSGDTEIEERIMTNIIDTTGIKTGRVRRFIDIGEGDRDQKKYQESKEVFGISGSCLLLRRTALEETKIGIGNNRFEYFDEQFFAYKEDIDLAWRLRIAGWKNYYLSQAVGYHFRSGAPKKNRFKQSEWVVFFSARNHLWCLLKNEFFVNFCLDYWPILFYQMAKKVFLYLIKPELAWDIDQAVWKGILRMLLKRRQVMEKRKIGSKEMKKWFRE